MGWVFKATDRIGVNGFTAGLISIDEFKKRFNIDPIGKELGQVVELLCIPGSDIAVSRSPMSDKPDDQTDVLAVQHGGNHYKGMKIQPVEYAKANDLDCLQFSVVKYITRHRLKAGAEDLKKCIHFAQMALKMDYGVDSKVEYSEEKKAGN